MLTIAKAAERCDKQLEPKSENQLARGLAKGLAKERERKRSTEVKICHGSREKCRFTAIFDRAETVPAEHCQLKLKNIRTRPYTRHMLLQVGQKKTHYGPTDQPTDRRTDTPSYRVAPSRPKMSGI